MIYYVSNFGCDTNDGLTPKTPWKTINKINKSISGGDEVRFCCNDIFYGRIVPPEGPDSEHPTILTSYGEGKKPVISQYMLPKKGAWEKHGENIYRLDIRKRENFDGNHLSANSNAGFFKVDGEFRYAKKFLLEELFENWDFYCDEHYIYVYLDKSPDKASENIQIAPDVRSVEFCTNLRITNLVFRGTGAHGISGTSQNAYIADCEFLEIGGSRLDSIECKGKLNRVRYGNGVEAWTNSRNITVERCLFADIYDVAITMQGGDVLTSWENCFFRHNVIKNCTQAFEIWSRGDVPGTGFINCFFEDNICIDCGYGWGHDARDNKGVAAPLLIYGLGCPTTDVTVRRNIISKVRYGVIFKSGGYTQIPETYKIYDNTIIYDNSIPFVARISSKDVAYEKDADYISFIEKLYRDNRIYNISEYKSEY